MIDAEAFDEHRPNHKLRRTYKESKTGSRDANEESDEQYLICHREVFGYSLTDKRWCAFNIDLIKTVDYSGSAFNGLLLPTDQKATLLSLVEVHTNEALQFGDLIQDKGKGMIFLLHGEPGTGKTLTAGKSADEMISRC
jgi:SpoVK/Ycf46/Vps4 family AAA+-type ATPase